MQRDGRNPNLEAIINRLNNIKESEGEDKYNSIIKDLAYETNSTKILNILVDKDLIRKDEASSFEINNKYNADLHAIGMWAGKKNIAKIKAAIAEAEIDSQNKISTFDSTEKEFSAEEDAIINKLNKLKNSGQEGKEKYDSIIKDLAYETNSTKILNILVDNGLVRNDETSSFKINNKYNANLHAIGKWADTQNIARIKAAIAEAEIDPQNKARENIKNKISTFDSTEKELSAEEQDHLQFLINTITTKSNSVLNDINQLGQTNTQGINDYILANQRLLEIKDNEMSFITNLTPEQTKTIYLRASTQLVTNVVNDHIHQMDTINDNNLLSKLGTNIINQGHIQNNIVQGKRELGLDAINNIDIIIQSLTGHQIEGISKEADKKMKVNEEVEIINYIINEQTNKTDEPIFDILKPFPTSNASKIRERIVDNQTIGADNARNFSDKQAKDISNNLLKRLGEIDPYYKFANNFSKHKKLYDYLTNPQSKCTLKADYDKKPADEKKEFENKLSKLTNPTKSRTNIEEALTALLLEVNAIDPEKDANEISNLAADIYGENQYRRVYSGAPESLKAEFDYQNDIYQPNLDIPGPHELIIDKLKGKTTEQINQLVEAVKTKDLPDTGQGDLTNAMNDLALNGNRSIIYFAKREYERLLKKHEDDAFLKPLLIANQASIEKTITSLVGDAQIQSIADIDILVSEIQNSDKAELIPRLKDFGIVQRPNPADGGASLVAIQADDDNEHNELFGKLAYQHLYKLGGETLKNILESKQALIEKKLGEAPDISIAKINELKRKSKIDIADFIEVGLHLGPDIDLTNEANKIFAELQTKKMIEEVEHNRPDLKDELSRNKASMIQYISENDEIVTPAHITSIYNEMTQATNDVDVHLAARKLGITFQDESPVAQQNRTLQYEKAATERMKDPLHFQQIRNNLDRYTKFLDHLLLQTKNAKFEESNRQTIEQIQNQTHDLKVQLAAYKSQCMYKLSENPTNAVMENHVLALNKYLRSGGVIEQIETNVGTILGKLSPDYTAYYQPSSDLPEAKPVDTHEEAIAEVRKYLGSTGYQVPASILMGTGRTIDTQVEFGVVPMDIEVQAGEVVKAVSVWKKDPETKSASLDLFFKSEKEMEKLCKVPRDGDYLVLFISVMKWAASNVKTLRARSNNKLAPVVISGLQPVLKEAIQLYCNFKGIRCQPPGNFSDAQIKTFTEKWKSVDPTDLGCREIKMLREKTTYKPPTKPPVPETTSNNRRPQ